MERKTHEVRSFYCRVLRNRDHGNVVLSGLKDSAGKGWARGFFCIHAKVEFRGNSSVTHKDFNHHYAKHQCTTAEDCAVRGSWVDTPACRPHEALQGHSRTRNPQTDIEEL